MSDTEIGPGGPLPVLPNQYNPIAGVGLPNIGTPVYIDSNGEAQLANGGAHGTSFAIGLTTTAAEPGQRVNVRYSGPLSLTPAQVAAILDTGTALTPGVPYFVSAATAGKITLTPPLTPHYVSWIGNAIGHDGILIALGLPFVGAGA